MFLKCALFFGLIGLGLGASLVPVPVTRNATNCVALEPGGPTIVTPDCIDSDYPRVIIDEETDQTSPIPHRRVSAHFDNTDILINVYLPPKSSWQGRFFHMVYPTQEADALDENLAFGMDSGGYTVQISGTIGYRADAAAAKFSRTVAANYYNEPSRQIYGYVYGGSGGSLQTVGAIENTQGVWQGAVPIIQAVPISFMNNPTVRCLSGLVLKEKAEQIAAAVRPGGSGNPYANLTLLEKAMLEEATMMGVPKQAWEVFDAVPNPDVMNLLRGSVEGLDPTYADDFWSSPGYLGTEGSELGDLLRSLKVVHTTTITGVESEREGAIRVTLSTIPSNPEQIGLDLTLKALNGSRIGALQGSYTTENTFTVDTTATEATVLSALEEGVEVQIDNRWFIAMHAYYRHQVPVRSGFYGYDQLRDDDGRPIYPQRPVDSSALVSRSTSGGGTHTGNITGKVIAVNNLLDYDAFPWHADWYQSQVKSALGDAFDDNFRLWYNENADHGFGPVPDKWLSRVFDFTGIYHQALRDLSAWVEEGIEPPLSTRYTVSDDNQVHVDGPASSRLGIQPVIELAVDDADASACSSVVFDARIEVPPNAGSIISVEWDFLGTGNFVNASFGPVREIVETSANFTYPQPGSYITGIRVTAHRDGDESNPSRRVMNIARVAVNVS